MTLSINQNIILFQNLPNRTSVEVMRFVDDKPIFKSESLAEYYRFFPLSISSFDHKVEASFPEEGATTEELKLFKQAFIHEVSARPCFRTFYFVPPQK